MLAIYTDAGYPTGPGTLLASGRATVPVAPCDLATAKLRSAPTLIKGTKYWVVASADGESQAALEARWYTSNNSEFAYNQGAGWATFPAHSPAFRVIAQSSGAVFGSDAEATSSAKNPSTPFGSNLFVDPDTGCNYDSNADGFDVRGPDNCTATGQLSWFAISFVANKNGVPNRISAPILLHNPTSCPFNKVTLGTYTDTCDGVPGTAMASGEATVPLSPCKLAVARLRNAPSLTKGVKYWVVATTSPEQSALEARWWASNNAQLGVDLAIGWGQYTMGTPAFMVE